MKNKRQNTIDRVDRTCLINKIDWISIGILVKRLTPYQYRFEKNNYKIDYYVTSGKYFDINCQKWGISTVDDIKYLFNTDVSIPVRTKNNGEIAVVDKYVKQGYQCLKRGWPDFCFFKDKDIIFIEVKRECQRHSQKKGLSKYQVKMIDIFKQLGLNVKVEYV